MFTLGSAQLDIEKQVIRFGERTVLLQRKPYLVLLYLIENRHRMVFRKELLDRFWDGREVYDQSLSKAVGSIRKALGDAGSEDFIETRWGLGYRYVGPFAEVAAVPGQDRSPKQGTAQIETAQENGVDGPSAELARGQLAKGTSYAGASPNRAKVRRLSGLTMLLSLLLAVVVLTAVGFVFRHKRDETNSITGRTEAPSLAVLPFTATAEDVQGQYLGLELADLVTAGLERLPDLSVRSSSTVRSVVGLGADPTAAAKKLRVQVVVIGKIQRSGNQTLAFVRLVNSTTGATLWSAAFPAAPSDLPATDYAIEQHLTQVLALHGEERRSKPSSRSGASSSTAYGEYMQAEFFATTRTRTSLGKAISLLLDATRIDPNYARAYASLANCYELEGFYGFAPSEDAYQRGKEAALKALSLDNSLVEAHVSLLSILTDHDWDWTGAEREFRAAIALDPHYAVAYQYYGYALMGMGRGQEALSALKQAAQIDPVSPSIQTSLGWGYYLVRQNKSAVDQCKRVLDLYPDFVPAHQLMGIAYGQMNQEQRAMNELIKAQTLESDDVITPVLIDYERARIGQRGAASQELARILAKPESKSSLPDYYVAAAWVAIGDNEKADASLERAFYVRSNWVIFLRYDSRFDGLRGDSQFQALLRRNQQPLVSLH
jgi:DNA-binding winged helix-turn-helix (wHTH) protein/tetratricopeptide (TPR) repeat protein